MTREEILKTAVQYVTNDRNTHYGEPEDSFTTIAIFWNSYLAARPQPTGPITPYDVANMMALLKVARLALRPKNVDSAIDLAGYAACSGEILTREKTSESG